MSNDTWDLFYGPNEGYALELYERYRQDPSSVDALTRAYFEQYGPPPGASPDGATPSTATAMMSAVTRATSTATPPPETAQPAPYFHQPPVGAASSARNAASAPAGETTAARDVVTIVLAARLARSIREYGHLAAQVDPLGTPPPGDPMLDPATHGLTDANLAALPASIVWPNAGPEYGSCLDAIRALRAIY